MRDSDGTKRDHQLRVILDPLLAETDTDIFRMNWYLAALCMSEVSDADRRLGSIVDRVARALLESASEWWTHNMFAAAVGDLRTPRTRAILVGALDDENRYVRWGAAEALSRMSDPASVEVIIEALNNEPWEPVRVSLINALGRIGDRRALSTLDDALGWGA